LARMSTGKILGVTPMTTVTMVTTTSQQPPPNSHQQANAHIRTGTKYPVWRIPLTLTLEPVLASEREARLKEDSLLNTVSTTV